MTQNEIPPIWQQWLEDNHKKLITNVDVVIRTGKYKGQVAYLYNGRNGWPGFYTVRLGAKELALRLHEIDPLPSAK